MKRVRFRDSAGNVRGGRWTVEDGDPVVTAAAGPYGRIAFGDETYDPDEVDILPPCEPTKIVCIGRNYADHAEEMDSDLPDRPMLFLKAPNAVASHGNRLTLPAGKDRIDFEAELGVVIGEQCRNVSESGAMDVVAGYTCVNDISNRDDARRKTGALFRAAAELGAIAADADPYAVESFGRYAEQVGIAFQIRDDVLDATADADDLGKPTGQDAEMERPSLVRITDLTPEEANGRAQDRSADALRALDAVDAGDSRAMDYLRDLAEFVVVRER